MSVHDKRKGHQGIPYAKLPIYTGMPFRINSFKWVSTRNPIQYVIFLSYMQFVGLQFYCIIFLNFKQNLIFRYLQNRSRISVWLYEQTNLRIEGCIVGFDEYMNLVLDEAEEVHMKTKNRKTLGRILLKGDNITLIQQVQ